MISKFLADMATKSGNAPLFDNPKNYDLEYEDVHFTTEDGVGLSGWLINPGEDKVIIQNHFGIYCSRAGYTVEGKAFYMKAWPEDINFLKHIKVMADVGYTVLAYDLRNHGESGNGVKPRVCDGQEEYKDVMAAVKFISNHDDYKNAPIGLLSLCMGSSATVLNYGIEDGLENHPNIKAMVIIQPLYTGAWFENWNIPKFLINQSAKYSLKHGGIDFRKSPIDHFKHITVPTMIVQNENDPVTDMKFVKACYSELKVEKEMVWTSIDKNRLAGYADIAEHPEKMMEWFGKFVK